MYVARLFHKRGRLLLLASWSSCIRCSIGDVCAFRDSLFFSIQLATEEIVFRYLNN